MILLGQAESAIAKAKTIDEVKNWIDKAEACRVYAKKAQKGLDIQNQAAEIKIMAERKAGDMLAKMDRQRKGDGRPAKASQPATLSKIGVNRSQSSRWQAIAAVPARDFNRHVAETKKAGRELTSTSVAKLAQKRASMGPNGKPVSPPRGKFDVIVIDPPWPMEKILREVHPEQVTMDYPTMQESELEDIKIPSSKDCHLWLWTTHKFMPMAFRLAAGWGLKYVCTFVWHKPGGFQPFNLPQYNCEFALYCRRGSPEFTTTKDFPVCFNAPRGKHSEKPEKFYDMVSRVTSGKRLDMFARRKIKGFSSWGNEV